MIADNNKMYCELLQIPYFDLTVRLRGEISATKSGDLLLVIWGSVAYEDDINDYSDNLFVRLYRGFRLGWNKGVCSPYHCVRSAGPFMGTVW